ncbi:MAG TPA: hypothetical protein DCX06_09760 [Opitutae bacterium]|nr:hypothetical protein [Opitutae bacterium]
MKRYTAPSFLALIVLLFALSPASATSISGDTTVYHAGKKRVHQADCPRYYKLSAEEKANHSAITYAEATAQNLPLCSRCPGTTSATDAGTTATATPNSAAAAASADANTEISDDTQVYWSGKKRVHFKDCRRMPTDPAEIAGMTQMTHAQALAQGLETCSRCPGALSAAGAGTTATAPKSATASVSAGANAGISSDTLVYWTGKKRVHFKDCRRMPTDPEEIAAMKQMTYAEALAQGLETCSRCPNSGSSKSAQSSSEVNKKKADCLNPGSSNLQLTVPMLGTLQLLSL